MKVQIQVGVRCVCVCVCVAPWCDGMMGGGDGRWALPGVGCLCPPPVMCEHVRGWHQATPMFSIWGLTYLRYLVLFMIDGYGETDWPSA